MATRRKFIQHSGAFALGSLLIPQLGKSGLFSERKACPAYRPSIIHDGGFDDD